MSQISRRDFIRAGGVAVLGTAGAVAASNDNTLASHALPPDKQGPHG